MKIKLIYPAGLDQSGRVVKYYKEFMPGLVLPYLAALIGEEHEVSIVNESVDELSFEEPADLVGITAMTSRITRGYQIAEEYRKRGVPVVMGGCHVSMLPQEALQHADSVVVGESEGLWEQIIEHAKSGSLRPLYKLEKLPSLSGLPAPRYDLLDFNKFLIPMSSVQSLRGCPKNCDFCTVTKIFGGKCRTRPVEDVIRDIRTATDFFFFVDDNLFAQRDYCRELFRQLKSMNKFWAAQASLDEIKEEGFLEKARDAGCFALYVGIESISSESIRRMGKRTPGHSPEEIESTIKKLKRNRIKLVASMVLSPDNDDEKSMADMVEFLVRNNVPILAFFILSPVPHSRLYSRMEQEGRLCIASWSRMDGTRCLFQPRACTPEEVEQLYWRTFNSFYSTKNILRRYLIPPHFLLFLVNIAWKESVEERCHPMMGMRHRTPLFAANDLFMASKRISWTMKLASMAAKLKSPGHGKRGSG